MHAGMHAFGSSLTHARCCARFAVMSLSLCINTRGGCNQSLLHCPHPPANDLVCFAFGSGLQHLPVRLWDCQESVRSRADKLDGKCGNSRVHGSGAYAKRRRCGGRYLVISFQSTLPALYCTTASLLLACTLPALYHRTQKVLFLGLSRVCVCVK